ncbi:hypothetical protein Q3G72_031548 [Acer saccharum]|nr:hypothetical protein Q3G72_031548 [Acer saccharum]
MVGKIRLSSVNGAAVDLTKMFSVISNNIISATTLGRVYEGEGNKSFAGLSKTAMDLMGAFCFEDMFPFFGWMDHLTGLAAKLTSTSKALHSFLDQVIEEHQISKRGDDISDKKDFVDLLLHLQKEDELDIDLTRENIKAILLDMFIGGTDNTATTMEWAMAELVKNPSMMKKAQEEVRRIVGEKSKIDETDINQMEYLKCIVKESLRGEDLDMSDVYELVIRKKFPLRLVPVMRSS